MNPVYDDGHSNIAVLFIVGIIYAASQNNGKITKIHIMIIQWSYTHSCYYEGSNF